MTATVFSDVQPVGVDRASPSAEWPSSHGRAAGIAWINSIGNLRGHPRPTVFGFLHDRMGNDIYAVLFLARLSALAFALVLPIAQRPRTGPHATRHPFA